MRTSKALAAAMLILTSTAAPAVPNAFWTFGFDLPHHADRAPRFGEAVKVERLATALAIGSASAADLRLATAGASDRLGKVRVSGPSSVDVALPAAVSFMLVDSAAR